MYASDAAHLPPARLGAETGDVWQQQQQQQRQPQGDVDSTTAGAEAALQKSPRISPRNSLGPQIINRKSIIMKSAPRVPSNLRMVVDAIEADPDTGCDSASAPENRPMTAPGTALGSESHRASYTRLLSQAHSPDTSPLPSLSSRVSSPIMRREYAEHSIMSLAGRSANSEICLPYPHTLDSYIPKQRPHSLNTINSTSCRLSLTAKDLEYTEYSYKTKTNVVVKPSMMRGWTRMVGGKIKFTIGQIVASPSLILKGNRDIACGNAQMNLSRTNKSTLPNHASFDKGLDFGFSNVFSRRSTIIAADSTSSTSSGSSSIKRLSQSSKVTFSEPSSAGGIAVPKMPAKSISVIEMAAAAELAADLELAEVTTALLSTRSSTSRVEGYRSPRPLHSSSDATDVEAETEAETEAGYSGGSSPDTIVDSPLQGPTRTGSAENIAKPAKFVPLSDAHMPTSETGHDLALTKNGSNAVIMSPLKPVLPTTMVGS
ncbi:hypothetical protein GGI07_000088 [Coemansia sp. Benny D115]|nr:hypothetical protein GGI07_000088 [Coemansia sp. Benny D115]